MALREILTKVARGLTAIAIVGAVVVTTAPAPANARVSTGAAVGIGLGSFALGTALGAAANPYNPYGYYAPAPPPPAYYYPPAPAYYPHSCWDPYYRRYYAC